MTLALPALAVAGAGGHGVVVAEAARLQGTWSSITLFDDNGSCPRDLAGFALGGTMQALHARLREGSMGLHVIVAIGRNDLREQLAAELLGLGACLAKVAHPSAILSPSASVGAGTVVLAGAIIGSRASVGRACIVNTAAVVEHDCQLADGVHLAPRAVLGGGVVVGRQAWLGVGASVAPGLIIGAGARIAAGTGVLANVP
jgi:sugar O-acyltransferase (sialic acid O-acetyltransferase NeuD family)